MREAARGGDFEGMVHHSVGSTASSCAPPGTNSSSACGNRFTSRSIRGRRSLQPNIDMVAVAESHAPILAAVDAGDVERACRLSREHQEYFERRA